MQLHNNFVYLELKGGFVMNFSEIDFRLQLQADF